jgi:hypothetical protein
MGAAPPSTEAGTRGGRPEREVHLSRSGYPQSARPTPDTLLLSFADNGWVSANRLQDVVDLPEIGRALDHRHDAVEPAPVLTLAAAWVGYEPALGGSTARAAVGVHPY